MPKLSTDNFDFPVVFAPKHISKCWNSPKCYFGVFCCSPASLKEGSVTRKGPIPILGQGHSTGVDSWATPSIQHFPPRCVLREQRPANVPLLTSARRSGCIRPGGKMWVQTFLVLWEQSMSKDETMRLQQPHSSSSSSCRQMVECQTRCGGK